MPLPLFVDANAKFPPFPCRDSLRVVIQLCGPNVQSWNDPGGLAGDVLECFETLDYLFHRDQCVNRERLCTGPYTIICRRFLYWQRFRHQEASEVDSVPSRNEPKEADERLCRAGFIGAQFVGRDFKQFRSALDVEAANCPCPFQDLPVYRNLSHSFTLSNWTFGQQHDTLLLVTLHTTVHPRTPPRIRSGDGFYRAGRGFPRPLAFYFPLRALASALPLVLARQSFHDLACSESVLPVSSSHIRRFPTVPLTAMS